jgi:tripartite-type tricarboxylate transporter receptor subunit TctC
MIRSLVLLAGILCAGPSFAQTYPSRPVRILVPAPAGSSPDIRARQIAPKLQEALGQPFIVENRPGGGGAGLIAAREAARAAPDGHTLLLALINSAIFDALSPDPCCRLNQELVPISRFTMTPLIAVINPSVPAASLRELIDFGKAKPRSITYGSAGPGSSSQLVASWIESETGIRMLEVPYKGVNAELPDVIAGQVMAAFVVPQVVIAPIRAGKLRALAVLSDKRLAGLPDVPTSGEAGLPGVEALVWNGIFAPAGTPRPIIDVLHRELVKAYNAPEIRAQVEATGSYVAADTPEEFAAFIRAEVAKWGKVGRAAGIKPTQ